MLNYFFIVYIAYIVYKIIMLNTECHISLEEKNPLHIICMDDKIYSAKHLKTYLSTIPKENLYKVVNEPNIYGMTPLHICTNDKFIRILIKNGIRSMTLLCNVFNSYMHPLIWDLIESKLYSKLYSKKEIEYAF